MLEAEGLATNGVADDEFEVRQLGDAGIRLERSHHHLPGLGIFLEQLGVNLPGFLLAHDDIKAHGVDTIACTAVNDIHVMKAWGKATESEGKILMLADGNGEFARAAGLDLDLNAAGMGHRSKRYSMIVEDGVVKTLNIETERGVNVSGAETIMKQLKERAEA